MKLYELTLNNFKNIAETRLDLSGKVNCFLGNNGMGKSNLLDAVYFLSFCKSFTGVNDKLLIRRGEDWAMVKGRYERRGIDEEVSIGLSAGRRKSLKRGGKEYQRLSSHIGSFPLVMIAPQDIDLIRGGGEERRRWMDMVISQSDPRYLESLIRYNNALEQRNRLLRDGCVDPALYGAIETMMELHAAYIYKCRSEWVVALGQLFDRYYAAVAGADAEHVTLRYVSHMQQEGATMTSLLDGARRHDEIVRHTSVGVHRDDIDMELDGMPMRRTGSQGQCKTFTIALRLAQYDFLRDATGLKPLLLLDDIFDKLDAGRVERIMSLATGDGFGQIFITDTNRTHIDEIVHRTGGDYRLWNVQGGNFTEL
ncbi:MAG: DNA replication and repair protein RecF [Duncaniella sp.]|nr:DNA replication and repair protein RecF [Duncaniella sp.]